MKGMNTYKVNLPVMQGLTLYIKFEGIRSVSPDIYRDQHTRFSN